MASPFMCQINTERGYCIVGSLISQTAVHCGKVAQQATKTLYSRKYNKMSSHANIIIIFLWGEGIYLWCQTVLKFLWLYCSSLHSYFLYKEATYLFNLCLNALRYKDLNSVTFLLWFAVLHRTQYFQSPILISLKCSRLLNIHIKWPHGTSLQSYIWWYHSNIPVGTHHKVFVIPNNEFIVTWLSLKALLMSQWHSVTFLSHLYYLQLCCGICSCRRTRVLFLVQ